MTFAGTQAQGSVSTPQSVTIANNGVAPLNLSGTTIAGVDPGDYFVGTSTCVGTVLAGASCTLTVRFSPQAGSGTRTATLTVGSNAATAAPAIVLTGTAGPLPPAPPVRRVPPA